MNRTFTSAVGVAGIAAIVMFLAISPVVAGMAERSSGSAMMSETRRPAGASETMTAAHPRYQRLERLIGRTVRGSAGEKLGKIEDVVLDSQDNSISYAVLSYGGFFGFRDKLFAVPWTEFQSHPEKTAYRLDVRKEYLKNAPGFDKDHWPNMADENWAEQIRTFYRQGRPADERMSESRSQETMSTPRSDHMPIKYRRLTGLVGLAARDFQGRRLGELSDVVIDTSNDTAVYGVVLLDTTPWALERKESIVPWSTVEVMPDLAALKLRVDEETLESMAFARHEFPDLGNPQYARSIESRYESTTPYWETLGFVPGEGPMGQQEVMLSESPRTRNVSAWQAGSEYNRRFDPELITTVRGKIQSIGVFSVAKGAVSGLRLRIRTDEGDVETIYAGPRPYIESQGVVLHFGDEITVTAAPTHFRWGRKVLMASVIRTDGQTLRLRAADGAPQWTIDTLLGGSASASR